MFDKNTITGLVLIAVVLVVFSFLSRPSEEQLAAQQRYYDSIQQVEQRSEELKQKAQAALSLERPSLAEDSTALFFQNLRGTERIVKLENEVMTLSLSTKGGVPQSVTLKDYMEQDKVTPVELFNKEEMDLGYLFYTKSGIIESKDYYFDVVSSDATSATLRLTSAGGHIDFKYNLRPESYLVDLQIQASGLQSQLAQETKTIDIEWHQKARQIEKGYTYESRLSQLTYRTMDNDVTEMSQSSEQTKEVEKALSWVAFKNRFFSSVLISNDGLTSSKLKTAPYDKESGYVKDYSANTSAKFDPSGSEPTLLNFYYGPLHYKTLSNLDDGTHSDWRLKRLVYLGWPLLRWVNQFFTINVFDWLTRLGLTMGWVLLLMTLIIKIVILPTTWKTYISSAKMKVLKPKVDEINKKYPNEADAMKKQQEIMTLYSQYRVSPMGGCLPMLIQFPILMALFLFVPSAIELRGQSFLWADDLSTYDAIVTFPFSIPFLGDHISLFCVLMTITNLMYMTYNMRMQDTGANPQMAAMKWVSYLMPVMFLFILNDYPAGLNYYYFLSTLFSVVTMAVMKKMTDNDKLLAQLEANKKDAKQMQKTGFAARLEQMQKQQEELQRIQQMRNSGKK